MPSIPVFRGTFALTFICHPTSPLSKNVHFKTRLRFFPIDTVYLGFFFSFFSGYSCPLREGSFISLKPHDCLFFLRHFLVSLLAESATSLLVQPASESHRSKPMYLSVVSPGLKKIIFVLSIYLPFPTIRFFWGRSVALFVISYSLFPLFLILLYTSFLFPLFRSSIFF